MSDLSEGLALIRKHARRRAEAGQVREAHVELMRACSALIDEFRMVHNPPGVRYWETYLTDGTRRHETSIPHGYKDDPIDWTGCQRVEISYHEYLSRQNIFDDPRDEL